MCGVEMFDSDDGYASSNFDGGDELGEKNVMGRGKGKKGDVQRRRERLGERDLTHVLTHS